MTCHGEVGRNSGGVAKHTSCSSVHACVELDLFGDCKSEVEFQRRNAGETSVVSMFESVVLVTQRGGGGQAHTIYSLA